MPDFVKLVIVVLTASSWEELAHALTTPLYSYKKNF